MRKQHKKFYLITQRQQDYVSHYFTQRKDLELTAQYMAQHTSLKA